MSQRPKDDQDSEIEGRDLSHMGLDDEEEKSRTSSSDNYSVSSGFQVNKVLLTDAKYDAKTVKELEEIR